jgi:pimeloyl-ACP methyl ester carboxylesterase
MFSEDMGANPLGSCETAGGGRLAPSRGHLDLGVGEPRRLCSSQRTEPWWDMYVFNLPLRTRPTSDPDDWQDNARDILNFLLHYMPPSSCLNTSLHLPLVPKEISQQRQREGFVGRTFVVVGHSFGGASAVLAASHSPRLFDSLILIDPVIESVPTELRSPLPGGAVRRRTRWSSRQALSSIR